MAAAASIYTLVTGFIFGVELFWPMVAVKKPVAPVFFVLAVQFPVETACMGWIGERNTTQALSGCSVARLTRPETIRAVLGGPTGDKCPYAQRAKRHALQLQSQAV